MVSEGKYDYRAQWGALSRRLSARLGAPEIGREVIDAVTAATGAASGAFYLADVAATGYRLAAHRGEATYPHAIDGDSALETWLRTQTRPAALPPELVGVMMSPPSPALVAPLRCQDLTIGVVLLGPAGSPYTDEDVEFVATVAQHAAGAIAVARLSESTAQARQAETFDRVTAFVVHDLKNSVAALSLLARNAVRHFDDPEFQRDTVTSLSQTVARMQRLLARLSSPGPALETLDIEAVEVGVLVAEVTAPLAGDPLVRLERDVATPVVVAADRRALRRVLENLITNAAEAIPRDGSIRVSVTEDDGHAVIAVEDTGCGISEDFLQRHLFTPFRSTKAGGWGIGLYHTKQLVDRHRGEIRVESIEGRGTTFWVKWPRWPKPETTPPGAVSGTRVWETV